MALPSANAVILQFTTASLTDGGAITGTFEYLGGGTFGTVNFTTGPGSAVTGNQAYTIGDGSSAPSVLYFYTTIAFPNPGAAELSLQLVGPDDWEDTVAAAPGASFTIKARTKSPYTVPSSEYVAQSGGDQTRGVQGGFVTVVPEPSTYAMVAGLGMVAFGLYRRFGQKA